MPSSAVMRMLQVHGAADCPDRISIHATAAKSPLEYATQQARIERGVFGSDGCEARGLSAVRFTARHTARMMSKSITMQAVRSSIANKGRLICLAHVLR